MNLSFSRIALITVFLTLLVVFASPVNTSAWVGDAVFNNSNGGFAENCRSESGNCAELKIVNNAGGISDSSQDNSKTGVLITAGAIILLIAGMLGFIALQEYRNSETYFSR